MSRWPSPCIHASGRRSAVELPDGQRDSGKVSECEVWMGIVGGERSHW